MNRYVRPEGVLVPAIRDSEFFQQKKLLNEAREGRATPHVTWMVCDETSCMALGLSRNLASVIRSVDDVD